MQDKSDGKTTGKKKTKHRKHQESICVAARKQQAGYQLTETISMPMF